MKSVILFFVQSVIKLNKKNDSKRINTQLIYKKHNIYSENIQFT